MKLIDPKQAVFWIRDILVRIRIRGSVTLTYGSGSDSYLQGNIVLVTAKFDRIRIGFAPWIRIRSEVNSWIRIPIEVNADPQQ